MTKSQHHVDENSRPSVAFLVVAAGRGSRAGEGMPKQYRNVAGMPVLRRTLTALMAAAPGAHFVTVIHPDDAGLHEDATKGLDLPAPVFGGATRQQSVLNGLRALAGERPDFVLVHDAARPFVARDTIARVLEALASGHKAVVPAVAVTDTLKQVDASGLIVGTVPRDGLYRVQTPQGFAFGALLEAHTQASHANYTDDAAVIEAAGGAVHVVEGDDGNFKLTTPGDFSKAEQRIVMNQADVRMGSGYDVHRFEAGDHVWLCGVKVPFDKKLKGHSDADVGLHALTDAILAALCDGDIGTHFPPSDMKWRGEPSETFLKFAADRVAAAHGSIAHVGVCLVCEKPKIGPHKDRMRARIAELLGIPLSRVSVQATTTEKLGFTGREEGIAAQATATLRLPLGEN